MTGGDVPAGARPDAREVEEALAWFREQLADGTPWGGLDAAKVARHSQAIVRAALAAGPEPWNLLRECQGVLRLIDLTKFGEELLRRVDAALAGARPGPENQAEPRGLDERHRDELQQRVDDALLGDPMIRAALARRDARPAAADIDPTIPSGYRLEDIRGYSPRDLGFGADGHSDEQAGGER